MVLKAFINKSIWQMALLSAATALAFILPAAGQSSVSPQCEALEQELASYLAGRSGNSREIARIDRAIARQQQALGSVSRQSRELGCERRGFFIFQPRRPPQCFEIEGQLGEMEDNLASLTRQRRNLLGGNGPDPVRDRLMQSLGRYQCGPQYRRFAPRGRSSFRLFQPPSGGVPSSRINPQGGRLLGDITTYRTLCVKTCDGSYFPISFSTLPSRFGEDTGTCNSMCPTADVQLFVHPNPGGSIEQMTTPDGQPYDMLPNAWRFRREVVRGCSCNATTLQLEATLAAQAARALEESMVTGDLNADGEQTQPDGGETGITLGALPLRDLDQAGDDSDANSIEALIAAKNGEAPEGEVDKAHINSRFATSADDTRKDFSQIQNGAGDKTIIEIERGAASAKGKDDSG